MPFPRSLRVEKLVSKFPFKTTVSFLDIESPSYNINIFKPCAGGRLYVPGILKEKDDVVVYLDSDTIVLGSDAVRALRGVEASLESQNSVLAGADEHGCDSSSSWYQKEKGGGALNSGVLLLNLGKIREEGLDAEWERLAGNYAGDWGDQDVINDSLKRLRVTELGCELNWRPDACYFDVFDCERCPRKPKIMQGTRSANVPVLHKGTIYVPCFGKAHWRFGLLVDALVEGEDSWHADLINVVEETRSARVPEELENVNAHLCRKWNNEIELAMQEAFRAYLNKNLQV